MVITPDIPNLKYIKNNGIKYFELVAEPVTRELLQGIYIKGWGYNGSIPGPTIQVYPDDEVNIRVYNRLSEATSVHWHGLDVPVTMDGVPDVQPTPLIQPRCYFDYHFTITNPPGTHMYHTHHNSAKQQMMGLGGALIILDSKENLDDIQRDYFIMLQEFKLKGLEMGEVKPGVYEIDPHASMDDMNFFTMNGRSFPNTTPLLVKRGDRARIRLGNIVHMAHPIHIHGHQFEVVASDGNAINKEARMSKNTINVASGETWDVEFIANNPGIWPFHCHIPHHMTNNMTKPMGGMVTTVIYEI